MSVRRILIISLAAAVVLAGTVVAVARIGGGDPDGPEETSPSPSRQPSPSPDEPSPELPPASPAPEPSSIPPAPPGRPVPPPVGPPPAVPEPPGYRPTMVTPRPGMDNVHPVTWRRAEVLDDRTVRIHYESGVAPCSVLDRVEVDYRASEIAIGLFEGSDPAFKNAACIMIAQFKAVDVTLDQPVNGRAIVEGNR